MSLTFSKRVTLLVPISVRLRENAFRLPDRKIRVQRRGVHRRSGTRYRWVRCVRIVDARSYRNRHPRSWQRCHVDVRLRDSRNVLTLHVPRWTRHKQSHRIGVVRPHDLRRDTDICRSLFDIPRRVLCRNQNNAGISPNSKRARFM